MGTFKLILELGDPAAQRFASFEALVDTGATYTAFPASVLLDLGVSPHRRATFELADGSQTEWDVGRTWVRLNGRTEMTLVVFGAEGVEPILGAVTIEEFLLTPDPIRQRLIPVPGLMMVVRDEMENRQKDGCTMESRISIERAD